MKKPILILLIFIMTNTFADNINLQPGLSGMWISDSSGQGLMINVARVNDTPSMVVTWYAFKNGEQVWLVGSQPFQYGDQQVTVPMYITSGADWGEDFATDDVVSTEWGTTTFVFQDCTEGMLQYRAFNSEFGEGEVSLSRLTGIDGLSCYEQELEITEAEGLKFMREEEKLARDVYLRLYRDYGVNVFNNIASSEQSHMDAILNLMNVYNIPDSSTGVEGEFNNIELQLLHDWLVQLGSEGLVQAYLVGALVEETDIKDIEVFIDATVSEDIIAVYENLLCGSRNHLRSFATRYESETGMDYIAQLPELSDLVDTILDSDQEQCGRP